MAVQNPTQPNEQEIEKIVRDYQMIQEQLRNAALQLDQLQGAKADMERAKTEIEKAQGKVYITIGSVIVETTKDKALADLKERGELTEIRINSANKQFNELKVREKTLGEKITSAYQQGRANMGPAGQGPDTIA